MKRLEGILPPIPTPFDATGAVAHDRLRENLGRWLETGLHGFVVLGSNGEYVALSDAEKYAVWETARQLIPPGKLFVAGCGADSTVGALNLVRRAAEIGADCALVVTPHYYKGQMTGAAMLAHYRALADAAPIPVLLYNVPANTGVDLEAATILALSEHPNIAGMKDSGGNLVKMAEVLANVRSDFAMFAGSGSFAFSALLLGARGVIPALGNVAPRQMLQLYGDVLAGRLENARQMQFRLMEMNRLVTARFGVPGLKAALEMLGFYGGPCRLPLLPLDTKQQAELRSAMERIQLVGEPA